MNLFNNFFTSALFFNILLYSTVICRISDKRKCADAKCSEPIAYATTLLHYFADDERLLSFPRNLKLKVFSKEAGNNPNFWEVEVYGKRGYVPKGLLREDKVLIPSSKLTHIVPTNIDNSPKQNVTNKNVEQDLTSVNMISATPELPVANSKGLFSTIGGVSADSVPMNSPDIKPQSTRKFQVFEGTTIYEDVVNEKPESPPTVIDDIANENEKSDKKLPLDMKTIPKDSSVPSMDIKPVNEITDENEDPVGTDQEGEKNVYKPIEKEEDLQKTEREDEGKLSKEDTPESSSGSGFLGNFISEIWASDYISSGAGEEDTKIEETGEEDIDDEEEEYKDGSAEEEDNENEKETSTTEGSFEIPIDKESEKEPLQSEGETLDTSHTNKSDAPNLIKIFDKSSPDMKMDNALKSEEYTTSEQETIQNDVLAKENTDVKSDKEETEESNKGSTEIKIDIEEKEDIKVDKQNYPPSTSEEKEGTVTKVTVVDKVKSESIEDSDLLTEKIIGLQQEEPAKSDSVNVLDQPPQQDKTHIHQKLTEEEKTGEEYTEKETASESIEDQSTEASEFEAKSNSDQQKVEESPNVTPEKVQETQKTDELQIQEELQTDEPKVPEQSEIITDSSSPKVQETQKTDELQIQEELQTDEPKVPEQSEIITDSSSVVLEAQEQLNNTIGSLTEAPARQLLFGSRQNNEATIEQNKYETTEAPSPPEYHDAFTPQAETPNVTSKIDNVLSSDSTYSSLPTLQSTGSPKYASVISRRIQSSESTSVNEILPHSEEEKESDPQSDHINDNLESTATHEEAVSPDLLVQSPKYSSVVNRQIGSFAPVNDEHSETPKEGPLVKQDFTESADVSTREKKSVDVSPVEILSQAEVKPKEEIESKEETVKENFEVPLQHSQPATSDNDFAGDVVNETPAEKVPDGGMFSWFSSLSDAFGSTDSGSTGTDEELPEKLENLDPSQFSNIAEETCSADGIEESCHSLRDPMHKEITWQESYTSEMWDLMEKVPLEATIWLVITAVVVLIFSLGHYYIEAHRRDGPLVAIINKLEREVLILKKESCIMEDCLQVAQQKLEAWNTSSSENDALVVELKQELEETKAVKAELEEQAAQLKEELETVTESGLEMHRLLEESLSSQDGSQVLLSTVETLREKLQHQEDEISGLSHTLSSKNAEVEQLQTKLVQAAEVARSLEDKVISVTREKEEEALQLRDKHRELISQLEEVMETKALEETRLSTEMSKLRLTIKELQKILSDKDSELETLKEVVKQLRSTDSNEKIEALFDVVGVQSKLKTAVTERDDFREKFLEEEGARKLLEGHMKKITQEVADLKDSFETAEREKIEALTKLQVLSNYFKEKESQLQKELGLQESMWLQKQSDDHTIYEQMRSLREENEKYKLQNESLKKEIVEQETSFKIQLANTEQKAHENWVASRQAERRLKEAQQESAQLRNRLTMVEKNANYSLDEKQNLSESNGDPSSPPPAMMFPSTTSPPFMMYGPPMHPGDYVPPPPLMGSPYPSDSRPPPLGRISSPPLDHRFSPPPPLSYPPYDYPSYGHHSPSPPPPMPPHHRNVHKPQPRELSREQKDHVPNYSPEAEKTTRRNKR